MYNRENPSQDYKELVTQYQILHTKGLKDSPGNVFFNGISLAVHIERLTKLILLEGVKSLLDYGCGKALLYDDMKYKEMPIDENGQVLPKPLSKLWQLDYFSLYDPAYEKYSKLPKGKYDAVICKHCGKDPDGQEGENIRLERNRQWVVEMSKIKKMREADKTPNIPVQLPIILGVFVAIGGIIFWSISKPDDCDS